MRRIVPFLFGVSLVLTACGGAAPEVGADADPALAAGRTIWTRNCASCHRADGSGGRGPQLNEDRVTDRFPDVADQIELVTNGRGSMPAFSGRLSPEEIEQVTRYTREVIAPSK